ncbi:MAG: hypothetical protein HGA22_12110 [Clostridiales bacterium]|nr:hypothetical protein [Clostridiales bacterium]
MKPWRAENFGGQGEPSVDWNMMPTVGGLYVAGAASGLEGCSFACSSGFYCGNRAVEYSAETEQGEINEEQLNAEINRVYAPVRRAEDPENCISWKELWAGSARVMQQDCAENLTIPILEHGLMWLKSIQEHEAQETYARNPHELARVLECETRITCSEVIMRACIEKLKADEKGIGRGTLIFNQMVDGEFVTRYRKDKYWLEAPYASSYLENYQIFRSKEN